MAFHGDKKEGTWLLANAENRLKNLRGNIPKFSSRRFSLTGDPPKGNLSGR